jgi:glutathione S-transferase
MIVLHQFEISPFCDKVRRILHTKRVAYRVHEIPLSRSFVEIGRMNRIGKLPVLEVDGRRLADSTEIAHQLEERFPDPPLLPRDPRDRALCHVLEDWADESLYFYEMTLRFTWPHNAERWIPELAKYDPAWFRTLARYLLPLTLRRVTRGQGIGRKPREMLLGDLDRHLDAVDGLLGDGSWLVGGALSLADVAVFAQVFCIGGAAEGARAIAARPRVAAWLERVDRATQAKV